MATAVRAKLGSTFNTTTGSHTVTATPAVDDLIVIVCGNTGITANPTVSDNNSDGLGAYTQIVGALKATSVDKLFVYVRNGKIGSATSTIFTVTGASSTGGGLNVFAISGALEVGSAAVRQSAKQENQAAGVPAPAPVLANAALTTHTMIGAIFNGTNPATMTQRAAPAYAEQYDVGYNGPPTGLETMTLDSGETASTITWGGTSASVWCSIIVELSFNFSCSAAAGAFILTGNNGSLLKGSKLLAGAGVFTLTGSNATFKHGYIMQAAAGTFTLTGSNATIGWTHILVGATGVFSVSGKNGTLLYTRIMLTDKGTFTLSGNNATLLKTSKLLTGKGTFSLSGSNASLLKTSSCLTGTGSFTLTGNNATMKWTHVCLAATGVFTLTGNDATMIYAPSGAKVLMADKGTFILSGNNASLLSTRLLEGGTGSFILSGQPATMILYSPNKYLLAGTGIFTIFGLALMIYSGAKRKRRGASSGGFFLLEDLKRKRDEEAIILLAVAEALSDEY